LKTKVYSLLPRDITHSHTLLIKHYTSVFINQNAPGVP